MPPTCSIGPVSTILQPQERHEVDRAGAGAYRALHRECAEDVLRDLKERRLGGVLVSAARCTPADLAGAMRLVREFPRVPAIVLVSPHAALSPNGLLALGNCGLRQLVDVRLPAGWAQLREVLGVEGPRGQAVRDTTDLVAGLHDTPEDFRRFVEALFADSAAVHTVRDLSRQLGVRPSTLVSRFFRARLPSPKRYLAMAGLVRAARLFENPGLSVADVAIHLDHSSPQSFGRHVKIFLGISPREFRRQYDGRSMLQRFGAEMVDPYRARLRTMSPLASARPQAAAPATA
jgi:AraC-like DNA-binding protein